MAEQRRVRIDLQYLGTRYAGWQVQNNDVTIQEVVEEALSKIVKKKVRIHASGRTDAGVHAILQPTHADVTTNAPDEGLLAGLNAILPKDIAVISVMTVAPDWNARFSAISKTYEYTVLHSRIRSVFDEGRVWRIHAPIDMEAMREGAIFLTGERDFTSFESSGANPGGKIRTITDLVIERRCEKIVFRVTGNGFLKQMVRNIVGTLIQVGLHKREPSWIKDALDAKDRKEAGPCAPPGGLCLMEVVYSQNSGIVR